MLGDAQARTFDDWLGVDFSFELSAHLKRFVGRSVSMGLVYVVFNWPQWPYLVLGVILIAMGVLSRSHPSHWLFLLYALFWLGVIVLSASRIAAGQGWVQWLITLLGLAFFAMSIGYFRKFRVLFSVHQERMSCDIDQMKRISLPQFSRLRLKDILGEKDYVRSWYFEYFGMLWFGDTYGFSHSMRLFSSPFKTQSIAIDIGDISDSEIQIVSSVLGIRLIRSFTK